MNILKGVILTLFFSLLISLIFSFVFRLPIPMGGIIGPFGEYSSYRNFIEVPNMVFTAWLFYGVFGGFIVFPLLGVLAGYFAGKNLDTVKNRNIKLFKYSFMAGLIPVLFISTLDFFIGKW